MGALLATSCVAGSSGEALAGLAEGIAGRLFDTGELYADGIDGRELAAIADRAGIAPDSAVCALDGGNEGRGVLCLRLALAAVLGHTSELAVALLGSGPDRWAGACFASDDYFLYSTASPVRRVSGLVVSGYDGGDPDHGVRGALERALIRAELTVEELGESVVAASEPVRRAAWTALDGADATRRSVATGTDVVAATADGDAPTAVLLEDGGSRILCAYMLTPVDASAP